MKKPTNPDIRYVEVDLALKDMFSRDWYSRSVWGQKTPQFLHLENGFTLFAMLHGEPIGLISVYWKQLSAPLPETLEAYIDIIEVFSGYKRMGVASMLVQEAIQRAKIQGAYQMRAWSSEDKVEAIPMWKALGFGLCPATIYPGGQEVQGYFVTKVL